MAIPLVCPNGHRLQVRDEFAGRRAKCPRCAAIMVVPQPAVPNLDSNIAGATEDDPGYEAVHDDADESVPSETTPSPAVAPARGDMKSTTPPVAETRSGSVADPASLRTDQNQRRRALFAVAAGGVAGFCAVLVVGVGLIVHFRSAPGPQATGGASEQFAAVPPQKSPEPSRIDLSQPPDLAALSAKVKLPEYFRPEVPVSLHVGVADPRVEVTLHEGPKEAKIENGVFSWTPPRFRVGDGKITIRYSADGERHDRNFDYLVSEIPVEMSFPVEDVLFPDDGRIAIAWGNVEASARKWVTKVAVVNRADHKILLERTTPFSFSRILLTKQFAIIHAGTKIQVLRLPDLAPVSQATLFRSSGGVKLTSDRLVFVDGGSLLLPDLSEPALALRFAGPIELIRLHDSWLAGGAVLDDEMREVRFFHRMFPPAVRIRTAFPPAKGGLGELCGFFDLGMLSGLTSWADGTEWTNNWDRDDLGGLGLRLGPSVTLTKTQTGRSRICLPSPFLSGPNANVPVACITGAYYSNEKFKSASSKDAIAVWIEKQLFFTDYAALGKKAETAEPAPAAASPYFVRPEPKQFLLASKGKTTVRYTLSGGKPPYKLRCEALIGQSDPDEYATAGAKPGEVLVDGEALIAYLVANSEVKNEINPWAPWLTNRFGSPVEVVDGYVADAAADLQSIVGRKFSGVPVAVPLLVTVTDADGVKRELMHSMIVELPRDPVVNLVQRASNRKKDFGRTPVRIVSKPPPVRVLWSSETSAIDVSNRIRESSARVVWTEPIEVVAERVLDEQAKFRELLRQPQAEESTRFQQLSGGLQRFMNAHGCLPPAALVGADDKPLLSWRVLMLPYVEQGVLFNMFHLDEPWDSEHNRKLIPFVPPNYRLSRGSLREGHSDMLALVGKRAAFPPGGVRRIDSFIDGPHDTALFVQVASEASVIWTKPDDLRVEEDPTVFNRLANQKMKNRRNESYTVTGFNIVFADGEVRQMPHTTDRTVLLNAARIDDGKPSGIRRGID